MQDIKLHIGCGEKTLPNFVQVDIRKLPNVDIVTSADKLDMFQDNSVLEIYCSHLLDHFGRYQVDGVLEEWYRVLKVGGILRIAVSDFEKIVEVYNKNKDVEYLLGLLVGGQTYNENAHGVLFDFAYLSKVLTNAGFKNIHRYDWREVLPKGFDDFSRSFIPKINEVPREDYEKGTLVSLNVECEK